MTPETLGTSDVDHGQKTAMTLAAIAYCQDIPGALASYAPGWQAAWLPQASIGGNLAYIAFNGVQYVVAIRGSLLSFTIGAFDDWIEEDLDVLFQEAWLYPSSLQKPMIAAGAAKGLRHLEALVGQAHGETMLDFLMTKAVEGRKLLAVTGHSLGANLATVYAPWLHFQIVQAKQPVPPIFAVLTFAAPTAGNTAFAQAFDAIFRNSWRYHNAVDIVPHFAVPSELREVAGFYLPAPQAKDIETTIDGVTITLAEVIDGAAVTIELSEVFNSGSDYSHTNVTRGSEVLNAAGQLCPPTSQDPLIEWFEQAGCQHGHDTYLRLLGASQFTCAQSGGEETFV